MPGKHYPTEPACIFCKIIAGEIPCARVYEDADVLAFLDISPIVKGHTLVLPKAHHPTLLDLPVSLGEPLMRALRLVAKGVQEATNATGFNCIQNNFRSAGQMVFHSHWHIIPRFDGDGLADWPGGHYTDNDEMQRLALSINARIAGCFTGERHE